MSTDVDLRVASLPELEGVIDRGLSTFVEVGTALAEIRERRLYRESHDDFDSYCRERWGRGRTWAYQLMSSAAAAVQMSTVVDTAPTNEAQARELARVEPERRADVWREASENGAPTAAQIREAAGPAGRPAGPAAEELALRERAGQIVGWANKISAAVQYGGAAEMAAALDAGPVLGIKESFAGAADVAIERLEEWRRALRQQMPLRRVK